MTSFSPEPEFWIEDGQDSGSDDGWGDWDGAGDSGGPGEPPDPGGAGGGPRRRWLRWAVLGTGLAVIAGFIVWQSRTGEQPESAGQTVALTPPSTTPPSTWAPTATDPAPTYTTDIDTPSFVFDDDRVQIVAPTGDGDVTGTFRLGDGTVIVKPPAPVVDHIEAVSTTVDPLPNAQGWQLQAYRRPLRPGGRLVLDGDAALIRYRPDDGSLTAIRLPGVDSTAPASFVVSGGTVVIHPDYPHPGAVVSPDGQVSNLADLLVKPETSYVFPGPGSGQVWVVNGGTLPNTIRLADTAGGFLGAEFTAPDPVTPWYGIVAPVPDGSGYLTVSGIGGSYVLQPYGDGFRRVTTGEVLASGPPGFLTYDCDDDAQCAVYYVDRATWTSRKVPVDYVPSGGILPSGVISPDGTTAAMADYGGSGAVVYLLDLATGTKTSTTVSLTDMTTMTGVGFFAFSPDSRYLMVAGAGGVVPVDVATGKALPTLSTGPVDALAIEPIT